VKGGGRSDVRRKSQDAPAAPGMCGRFTQAYTWQELVALYRLTQPAVNLQAHYDIAPTDTVDVVRMRITAAGRQALAA